MTRESALAAIAHLEAPLGPLRSPEEAEAEAQAWAASQGEEMVDALIDLVVRSPGPDERRHLDPDEHEYGLSRALTLLGRRHSGHLRARAGALLGQPVGRATLIEVIGALGDPAGTPLLAPLADERGLSEEEATRLACALGEIGGEGAAATLKRLEAHPRAATPRVAKEIRTAWESLERLSRAPRSRPR